MGQSPFAKNSGAISSPINRRRSSRIEFVAAIVISGRDATGQPFREETETIFVSAHGANFRSSTQLLIGMQLTVENVLEGVAEKAICIRVTPPEHPEESQIVAIQLVTPRNVWGMKNPPADWQHAIVTNAPAPTPPEVFNPASGNAAKSAIPGAPSNVEMERRVAEITEAALHDLRRRAALIMQDSLREFESCLKTLEVSAETRIMQHSENTAGDAEKSLDHLLYEFLEQLTVRSKQVAAESEEDLRRKIAELFSPFLKMASGVHPGAEADAENKK